MIRIDEIYYNVFVKALQHRSDVICHWFDPFGSVAFDDMCVQPPTFWPDPINTRLIFWDQEPLYQEFAQDFFDQFEQRYKNETAQRIVITSEIDSWSVKWIEEIYGYKSAHYFFHGWAALDWYRGYNHSYLDRPIDQRKYQYPFVCPNNIVGGNRVHRLKFLSELAGRDLHKTALISFPSRCPHENQDIYVMAEQHGIDLPKIDLPLVIDRSYNHANHSHRIDFWDQAQTAFAHVVTETVYTSDRVHLTEKTFKPIVLKQPFLLVAPRNSLAYLQTYGFKTFDALWDESYDHLDDKDRLCAIADICSWLCSLSYSALNDLSQEIKHIVDYNHDWFYGGFQHVLWKELTDMIEPWR